MIITSKLSNEALLKAIYKAAAEYSKLIENLYLIIGQNKNTDLRLKTDEIQVFAVQVR